MATTIKVRYSDDAMFGSDEFDGYDVDASYEKFESQVMTALTEYNPGWQIEFEHGINDDIQVSCETLDDFEREHEIKVDAEDILHTVWESWDWVVNAE